MLKYCKKIKGDGKVSYHKGMKKRILATVLSLSMAVGLLHGCMHLKRLKWVRERMELREDKRCGLLVYA